MDKRYVITGLGVLSPFGIGLETFWQGIKDGVSPIKPITYFDGEQYVTTVAGQVPEIKGKDYNFDRTFNRSPRITKYSILASTFALQDAGLLELSEEEASTMGIYIGTRNGATEKTGEYYKKVVVKGPYRSNPLLFQETVYNSIAAKISLQYKITGPNYVTPTGENAMMSALDLALLQLQTGRVKNALVGGVEEFTEVMHQAYCHLKMTATDDKSRPFDLNSQGIIFSEGAVIMVIEDLEDALERGANIYGEIASIVGLNDYHQVYGNDVNGESLAKCMQEALQRANLTEVDCLITSANGNPNIDQLELKAIKKVFKQIPITNIKSLIGETSGAGAAINIVSALMMIRDCYIPPIANLTDSPEGYDFVIEPRQTDVNTVMINSISFGGNNFSLCIKKYKK
ncbi:MAG: beta-ketoacyl-[acyl-carrier-protein] synthase family protein [Halanaerobiales bacterium]|nr:beta-ketoacyl-[acyl-carrier-protein] synthase family protein [Halanaerobiales bacterium]